MANWMDPGSSQTAIRRFLGRSTGWSTGAGILSALLLSTTGAVSAQTMDLRYENTVQAAQVIKALSGEIFGEIVNDYSGATSFTHIDVSVPGNDGLPVRLGRSFAVEDKYGLNSLGGFGDWDVDVPYITGTFSSLAGWTVDTGSSPNRYKRCSLPRVPHISNANFTVDEIWSGYQLNIPGGDNGQLIAASYSDAYPEPTDGLTYPWITKGQSRLRCLAQTKNGYTGEAFALITSSGLTYYFDWGVEVAIRGIGKDSSRTIARKRVYLLASRIEDRFGSWVNYAYSGSKLTSISSSDGRQISLTYSGNNVATVSSSAGVWTYQYDGGANLIKVTQPDASSWSFGYTGSLKLGPPPTVPPIDTWGPPTCDEQFPAERAYEYRVTHPSGAMGTFKFENRRFYRAHVRWMCNSTPPPEKYEWLVVPNYFDSYAIMSKTITGPGIAAQVYSYDYGVAYESLGFCASSPYSETNCVFYCPPSTIGWCSSVDGRWVTISRPDGSKIRRFLGVRYGVDEGRLIEEQILDAGGAILSRTTHEYVKDEDVATMPFGAVIGSRLTPDPAASKMRPQKSRVIIQDGTAFRWVVDEFDAMARPVRITKSSGVAP